MGVSSSNLGLFVVPFQPETVLSLRQPGVGEGARTAHSTVELHRKMVITARTSTAAGTAVGFGRGLGKPLGSLTRTPLAEDQKVFERKIVWVYRESQSISIETRTLGVL